MQEAHAYCEANKEKFAQERANLTAEREAIGFKLGWMQAPVTQPLEELWGSLFTADTLDEQKKVHQAM
ncbi:hypothetical protein JCM19233_1193 [Vibrio astriarenae]|nr:hypothetical protein JCM19233_1193 [Vibrio sp. C7]